MNRCKRCILPDSFPGIHFNNEGFCQYCQSAPSVSDIGEHFAALKLKLDSVIEKKRRNSGYDCIVSFSGGKDSSFALYHLVKTYNLSCLAVTINNGFISTQAELNCKTITGALGVDFIYFTPAKDFMNRLYKTSVSHVDLHSKLAIKRASSVCNSCINLINNVMVRFAVHHGAPMIAGGYIGGQVPRNSVVIEFGVDSHIKIQDYQLNKYLKVFGENAKQYMGLQDLSGFPSERKKLSILNPLLSLNIPEQEIRETISKLGWIKTNDTGLNSSNCKLNDLGIYLHYQKYNFNPYLTELAEQVRFGHLSREEAIQRADSIPVREKLSAQAKQIGLNSDEY